MVDRPFYVAMLVLGIGVLIAAAVTRTAPTSTHEDLEPPPTTQTTVTTSVPVPATQTTVSTTSVPVPTSVPVTPRP